jgi:hypothetical protein
MPTINQKEAFKKLLQGIESSKKTDLGAIMREVGYSNETSKQPGKNLVSTKGFQELLAQIEDDKLMARLYSIALKGGDREAIKAVKEVFKLKDRYPSQKYNISGLDELKGVFS